MLKTTCLSLIIVFFITPVLVNCSSYGKLKPFKSDGCSMFPDKSLIDSTTWCECCVEHDIAYWKGGTRTERDSADFKFKKCILKTTGNKKLADFMYNGVRLGGSAWFPNWYRWGYGWNYGRGYKPLSLEEQKMTEILLKNYFDERNVSATDSTKVKCPCNKD